MAVETLAAFRAAPKGENLHPIIIATKGTDGEIYIAETNPATGALITETTLTPPAGGFATETTSAAILAAVDGVETLIGTTNTNTANIKTAVDLTTTAVNAVTVAVAAAAKPEYARANAAVLHNFAVTPVVATLFTTVIASIAAKAVRWQFANTSGSWMQIASGAIGSEFIFCQIPPGGAAEVDKMLIATTRISVTSDENVASGKLSVCSFV
jgi:hypothetical protein